MSSTKVILDHTFAGRKIRSCAGNRARCLSGTLVLGVARSILSGSGAKFRVPVAARQPTRYDREQGAT